MKQILILATFLLSLPVFSAVNMRNGSYTESWIDFVEPGDGYNMTVERFYSSRSLFIGLFGFGWCSDLETYLTITSDGIINLTECGGGLEITYYPENFQQNSDKQTIHKIVQFIAKERKLSSSQIQNLKSQLRSNTKMKFEYANRLHLVDSKKLKTTKNTFIAKAKGLEKIYFDGKFYQRKKYDGSVEKFNVKGRLIQRTNPVGAWVKLNYKGKKLSYLVDAKGRRINFTYDMNGKLVKIFNGRGLTTTYKFQGENLVSINNMWSKTYTYNYDSNHNLLSVMFPDKTQIRMAYDTTNDWIKSYTNRKGCREDFQFLLDKKNPKDHYWGTFKRQCKDGSQISGRHEFWYKKYSFSKDKYLHRAREIKNQDSRDVYFHPYLGRPISIRENNSYLGYAYFLNGLVNKKEYKLYSEQRDILDWYKSTYKHDFKRFKLTEVAKNHLNKNGKSTKKERTFFKYNRQGLLHKAYQKAGSFINVAYNQGGQVTALKNHKKEKLQLDYEAGVAKPTGISHNKLGSIKISYDNQGEVSDVKTTNKRTLASSVIEKFMEMINFLGPMGDILKI